MLSKLFKASKTSSLTKLLHPGIFVTCSWFIGVSMNYTIHEKQAATVHLLCCLSDMCMELKRILPADNQTIVCYEWCYKQN